MNEENGKNNKPFEYETNNLIRSNFNEKEKILKSGVVLHKTLKLEVMKYGHLP